MLNPIIAFTFLVDGSRREVYEELDGKQYILDNFVERVYGTWIIPEEESELPIIVVSNL